MDAPDIANSSFWHKKTIGVTNIYLYGGAAVVIGVIAWRMKSSVLPTATPTADTTSSDTALPSSGDPYSGLGATSGGLSGTPTDSTVTTPATNNNLPNASIPDNQTWVSKGIQWLVANNHATGTEAQAALTAYTSGANYTYDQNVLINQVIKEQGPPPDPLPQLGAASPAPAQRQFTAFPGVHTVKGANDNTFPILSQLYYNRNDDNSRDLLQAHNTGIANLSSFSVGTKVNIPVYEAPKFYTATKTVRSAKAIAAANGISETALGYYNDGGSGSTPKLTFPVAVGTKVRVG